MEKNLAEPQCRRKNIIKFARKFKDLLASLYKIINQTGLYMNVFITDETSSTYVTTKKLGNIMNFFVKNF